LSLLLTVGVSACTDVDVGDGTQGHVTVVVCPTTEPVDPSSLFGNDGGLADSGSDPPGVVATCDDHKPCTVDIQCTPCSQVPEEIRYVKATCTPDDKLSPFCFDGGDPVMGTLLYTGCTHFIADPTPPGVKNACFPVAYASGEVHAGVCNSYGVCVENP
jgi:hypothetical protein